MEPRLVKRLAGEIRSLVSEPEDCIEAWPCEDELSQVRIILTGPSGTPYAGGRFQITLQFGEDYPQRPPSGRFSTRIFHPNVSETGEICVNILKADWQPHTTIRHICRYVRCLLIQPNADSALNEEAARMLQENYLLFSSTAAAWARAYAMDHVPKVEGNAGELRAQTQSSQNIIANVAATTGVAGHHVLSSPQPRKLKTHKKSTAAVSRRRL